MILEAAKSTRSRVSCNDTYKRTIDKSQSTICEQVESYISESTAYHVKAQPSNISILDVPYNAKIAQRRFHLPLETILKGI